MLRVPPFRLEPSVSQGRAFSLRRMISLWLRLPISGPVFRLYARRREWRLGQQQQQAATGKTRVLVVNLMGSLGDAVCYLAMADILNNVRPDVEITWLTDAGLSELVGMHAGISRVMKVTIPRSLFLRIPTLKSYYRLWCTVRAVKALSIDRPFDVALVPRGGVDPAFSAHAVWALNLPASYGYSHKVEPDDVDHNWGDCLLTNVIREVTARHEAMRAITVLQASGLLGSSSAMWDERMPIRGLREMASKIDGYGLFKRLGLNYETGVVVLSPGAGLKKKSWAPVFFREICARLAERGEHQIVVTGTKVEINLCAGVVEGLGYAVHSCAGKLTLPELIALLSHAELFIGNDSGTGHLAGGLGVPTISLHAQAITGDPDHISAPEHYRPAGSHVTVIQPASFLAPCRDRCESRQAHCINQISVDEVWNAAQVYLDAVPLKRAAPVW